MISEKLVHMVVECMQNETADVQLDRHGQVVIHTGLYVNARHDMNNLSKQPDPGFNVWDLDHDHADTYL